jgi:hypothetical protein
LSARNLASWTPRICGWTRSSISHHPENLQLVLLPIKQMNCRARWSVDVQISRILRHTVVPNIKPDNHRFSHSNAKFMRHDEQSRPFIKRSIGQTIKKPMVTPRSWATLISLFPLPYFFCVALDWYSLPKCVRFLWRTMLQWLDAAPLHGSSK